MNGEMPKMQREFEEHIKTLFDPATVDEQLYCDENGYYDRYATMLAWSAWQEATRQAMERCAAMCDAKFLVRSAQGFPREASTARNLRDAIRALSDVAAQEGKQHG